MTATAIAVQEKPILFSGAMVRAILEGRKTQTRRVIKADTAQGMDCTRLLFKRRNGDVFLDTAAEGEIIAAFCPYGRGPRVTFKPIPRTNGKYFAGDDGVIYNSDRKPMSPWLGGYKQNYQMVAVGELRKEYVHQLICEAFYGVAPEGLPQVRHMDGNSKNNTPMNLDWGTPEQNRADSSAHGSLTGSSSPHARLSDANVEHIRQQRGITTIPHLAALFDVDVETVRDVLNGKTWANHIQPPRNLPAYIPEQPGDRLWVRETFALQQNVEDDEPPFNDGRPVKRFDNEDESGWLQPHYRATDPQPELTCPENPRHNCGSEDICASPWQPSIHMPRWASRLTLEIVSVKVERVQEISEEDAQAEGVIVSGQTSLTHRLAFISLWDSINGKRTIKPPDGDKEIPFASWESNP